MKPFSRFLLITAGWFVFNCCVKPIHLEVCFFEETEEVVSSEGGIYYFDYKYVPTKTSVSPSYQAFEYRISIDGVFYEQQIVYLSHSTVDLNPHVEALYIDGFDQVCRCSFKVPANDSSHPRRVTVETLTAKDCGYYKDHVDPGDNTWQRVWLATQLGNQANNL